MDRQTFILERVGKKTEEGVGKVREFAKVDLSSPNHSALKADGNPKIVSKSKNLRIDTWHKFPEKKKSG